MMSGLVDRLTQTPLPLRSSSIYTDIKGFTARTTAILTYYNDNRTEIEGLFVLPLDHGSAIVDFECVIEGHYIYAEVRDFQHCQDTVSLYENEAPVNGIFHISIGRIPPWILIEIQVTMVCEISVVFFGDALKYTLPQTFSPKLASKLEENSNEQQRFTAISTLGYTFQLEIFIEAPCLLCGVQSNTHPIQVDAPPLSKTGSKIKVTLPDDFEPTNEIFELLMFLCRPREPYIIIEQPCASVTKEYGKTKNPINNIMHNSILMLSYSPDISNFQKELDDNLTNQAAEFYLIFHSLVENNTIQDACRLFLRSLPSNCYFNILCTGGNMEPLFKTSQSYSSKTIEQATAYITTAANYSESASQKPKKSRLNLLEAIRWVYCEKTSANIPRQAFIIGQHGENVYNNEIIELARRRHHLVRFFCVYLHNEDTSIYRSLSAITNGNCYIVENDAMVSKQLIACLKAAMKPAVTNLTISWILPDAYDVIYTPENLPVLHLGNRLNLYAILDMKEHESNLSRQKPSADSINSIKEFWFEDYDFYDDQTEGANNCSSHDLLTEVATDEVNTPENKSKENLTEVETTEEEPRQRDSENEVFLTEEEAFQLKDTIGWQKRLSVDRVQKWRVSKNPENSDLDTAISDTECEIYMQYQQKGDRRKKSSSDGFESIGSSNSYGSNLSSSSHFLGFPGFPTRLGSCRSVEARSPHMPKFNDDNFTFSSEHTHERPVNTDRYSMPEDLSEVYRKKITAKPKGRKKLTQALLDEQLNTHLIERSNETVICRLLENIVTEKREKLNEWVNVQEEMTQCNWPILQKDMKRSFDKTMWRDSGIGHRSSSEPRTSDMEDETHGLKKSSSSFILHERRQREDTFETKSLNFEMKTFGESEAMPQNVSSEPDILEAKKQISKVTSPPKAKKLSHQEFISSATPKTSAPPKASSTTEKGNLKKKLKAKNIWNNLVDKVKNLTSSVSSGKSGETNFTVTEHNKHKNNKENMTSFMKTMKQFDSSTLENEFTQLHQIMKTEYEEKENKKPVNLPEPKIPDQTRPRLIPERSRHRLVKTRPLIENSRTISTSSMIEIGQTEIGDIDSLHLLPSQALIYLSGNFGNRKFKRIIPFQMEVASGSEESGEEYTIHQLAAKSIIRDLEIQMDEDTLLENTGRNYIKSLASDVSRSAHILSKHTAVVMVNDECKGNEVISIVKPPVPMASDVRTSRPTYLKVENVSDMNEPLYEIQREMSPLQPSKENTTVYHTKLILKSPQFHEHTSQITTKTTQLNENTSSLTKIGYLRLIDLMHVDGYWEMSHVFAEILTVNYMQLRESCPFADITIKNQKQTSVHRRTGSKSEKLYDHIWTTTLALVWMFSYWEDFKEEWVLVDEKAKKWLKRKRLPTGFTLPDIFIIAQQTLKILKSNSRKASIRNT